jgi:hypothetical protein
MGVCPASPDPSAPSYKEWRRPSCLSQTRTGNDDPAQSSPAGYHAPIHKTPTTWLPSR